MKSRRVQRVGDGFGSPPPGRRDLLAAGGAGMGERARMAGGRDSGDADGRDARSDRPRRPFGATCAKA
jgi:hypothetical protein